MKFVRELPPKRGRENRYNRMVSEEGHARLRQNPSKWALIAEQQPKNMQASFSTWGKRVGLETATRTNPAQTGTIDLYARYQPTRRGGMTDA